MTASTADFPPLLRRRALLGLLLTTPLAAAGCTTASGAGQRYAPLASLTSTAATATSSEATSEATGAATPAMTTRLPRASSTAQATAAPRSAVAVASTEPPLVSQQNTLIIATPFASPATQRATGTTGAPDAPSLRLAYVREHDLYVRDEAGTITRLTSDGGPMTAGRCSSPRRRLGSRRRSGAGSRARRSGRCARASGRRTAPP